MKYEGSMPKILLQQGQNTYDVNVSKPDKPKNSQEVSQIDNSETTLVA